MPRNTLRDQARPPAIDCRVCEGAGYVPSDGGGVAPCGCGDDLSIDLGRIFGEIMAGVHEEATREDFATMLLEFQADALRRGVGRWFILGLERMRKRVLGMEEDASKPT